MEGRVFVYLSGAKLDMMTDQEMFEFVKTARDHGFAGVYVGIKSLRDYKAEENYSIGQAIARQERHRQFVLLAKSAGHYVIFSCHLRPSRDGVMLNEHGFYSDGGRILEDMKEAAAYANLVKADEDGVDGECYGDHPMQAVKKHDIAQPEFECMGDVYRLVAKKFQTSIIMPVGSSRPLRSNWIQSQLGKRHLRWYNARIKAGRYRKLANGNPMNPDVYPTKADGFEFKELPNPMFGYFVTGTGAANGNSITWTPEQLKAEALVNHPEDAFFYYDYNHDDPIALMKRM